MALLLSSPAAWAQASGSNNDEASGTSLADQPPAENVRGGAVWQRAPGRIIDLARARHMGLRDLRLSAQRSGETATLAPEPAAGSELGGSLSSLFGGSFSSLINTFLNSGLAGALGGQTGGSLQPAGNSADSGGTDFSNLPPEVLQMLAGAGIDLKDLNQKQNEESSTESAAQLKSFTRAQTNGGQQEPKFVVRWADAMLSTLFTAITVGFQTQDFIDILKDVFRPLFIPPESSTDGADGTEPGGGSSSDQDAGNDGGSDGGGGGVI